MMERQDFGNSLEEIKAVNRLLEVDEKRSFLEDSWQSALRPHLSLSLQMKAGLGKKEERSTNRADEERILQKRQEKERLNQLVREFPITQHSLVQKQPSPTKNDWRARLSPIKSNLTFYRNQQDTNSKGISSSMTFYGKGPHEKERSQSNIRQSYRIKEEQSYNKAQSNIVYFKPNKSQTVRELLNQMRVSREQSNMLLLNSTHYNDPIEQSPNQVKYSKQEEQGRYRHFHPIREDEMVVFAKAREGENIWKRKFKESWQRVKKERQGKRTYFKRLIVND